MGEFYRHIDHEQERCDTHGMVPCICQRLMSGKNKVKYKDKKDSYYVWQTFPETTAEMQNRILEIILQGPGLDLSVCPTEITRRNKGR